jgi:pimeloyl-ACP methyl ester carboxylesterase
MIWSRTGGSESGPLLVLLHGLGATGEVFAGLERELAGSWPGGWLVLDLPGHGRSDWAAPYSFRTYADQVRGLLPTDRALVVLGHSMGGVVALELADGTAPVPLAVVALGVKVSWPERDVAGAQAMAARAVLYTESREDAVARHLKLAGLVGLVDPAEPAVDAGVVETPEGWRVAQDPASFGVGVPAMGTLLGQAACPVLLARGERDHMVTAADLAALTPDAVTLPGLGHNAHVEDPAAVLELLTPYA